MKWQNTTLENACLVVTDGAHASPPSMDDGLPMASVKDLHDWGINLSSCRRISSQDYERLCASGCRPETGDVLIAKDGNSCLQTVCVHSQDQDLVLLSSVAILRPNPAICDSYFLKYHLSNPLSKAKLMNFVSGVAIPRVVLRDFKKYTFLLPPIDVQKKIACTLSAYDCLIENNRRRMALLEDVARQLYHEWFVCLRFPGYEHTRIVDGVPEGWSKGVVSDFYETSSGGTPSRKRPEFFTGDIPWVKTQELNNGFIIDTDEKITEDALKKSSAKLFPEKTILVALYGATVGETGILAIPATTNQACCAIIPKGNRAHYIHAFLLFRDNKEKLMGLSAGAAQNNISQQIVRAFGVIMPPKSIIKNFVESLEPAFDQWLNLHRQNHKLCTARDLLLPKLMSGEIAV